MKKAKYKSLLINLFEYGLLAERMSKFIKIVSILLYIGVITGLLSARFVSLSELGTLVLRIVAVIFIILLSSVAIREIAVKTEKRKTPISRRSMRGAYVLLTILAAISALYVLLLHY